MYIIVHNRSEVRKRSCTSVLGLRNIVNSGSMHLLKVAFDLYIHTELKIIYSNDLAAFEMRENKREPSYHNGAFGHTMHNSWSCCKQKDRNAEGCESSTACSAHVELQDEDAVSLER